ncbi:MAG: glycerate kinase [Proteobacteria bacterium]|nr:glycerate kinase [Pseudomonadota bacterium]
MTAPDMSQATPYSAPRNAALLERLFATAVAAAHPSSCLTAHLPAPPAGKLILLAAGKAAGSMTEVAERHYCEDLRLRAGAITGLAVTRHGYARPTRLVTMVEAGHPVPDSAGLTATARTLAMAASAGAEDRVLVLLSGGASANWIAPAAGITLAEKAAFTRALLKSGASISEINTLRKHLSRVKGGRLGVLAAPAPILTLAISDVPGDDPAVIGSGPTVPDPMTLADARAILARHALDVPASIARALADPANESPKPGNPAFRNAHFRLVARPADVFARVAAEVGRAGFECLLLGDSLEGEARDIAAAQGRMARELRAQGRRAIILSGGELTVSISGQGRGGPNQEFALALALAIDGTDGICAMAADTDGTDGGDGRPDDPAGAMVDGGTAARARAAGLDPAAFLANNDSTTFFTRIGGLMRPGPTFTNVNDFRAIVVDSA